MGEPQGIFERCLRISIRHEIEDAKSLDRPRRSVNPGIVRPGAIVSGMPYTDCQNTRGSRAGTAGPAVEPNVTHIGGVVPRRDIGVWRRKYRQAAAIEFSGDGAVANVGGPPVRSASHHGLKPSVRVVVRDRRNHFSTSGSD